MLLLSLFGGALLALPWQVETPSGPLTSGGTQIVVDPTVQARASESSLASSPSTSEEPEIEIRLSALTVFDVAYELAGHLQKSEAIFQPELEVDFGDRVSLTAVARFRFDGERRLEPTTPRQASVSSASRRHFVADGTELELRELYADWSLGSAFLRVGKQQVVWGQADGLKILDVVNPQTFREFILDEFEDSRIPLWSVNLELRAGAGTLQILWVLDQSYHDLPEPGSTFEITAPFAGLPTGLPLTIEQPLVPDRLIKDSDAGLRYSLFAGGWDVTFNYFYHYQDFPVIRSATTASGLVLKPSYERTHLIGGTLTNSFGDFTLRGEYGLSTDAFFAQRVSDSTGEGVSSSPELSSVVGLDWSGLRDTIISGQLFQSTVVDYTRDLARSRTETNLSFLFRRTFVSDTIETQLLWLRSLSGNGTMMRPRVRIDYSTRVQFEIYADFFAGDPTGVFGQFDARDRAGFIITLSQ